MAQVSSHTMLTQRFIPHSIEEVWLHQLCQEAHVDLSFCVFSSLQLATIFCRKYRQGTGQQ